MAANDFDWASTPLPSDLPVRNYGGSDIPAFSVVKLDTGNVLSGPNESVGVALAGTGDYPYGVTVEPIPAGKQGRARCEGIVPVTADKAISAGAIVRAGFSGDVTDRSAGNNQLGQAITASAALGDTLLCKLAIAANNT
jgi:predicted RecA/RadA family phage recombinase